jgi:hypothetical protein
MWVNGVVMVEGVEADDYERSPCLISVIKGSDRKMVRRPEDLPDALREFDIVDHATEIQAPYSRRGFAAKIAEDDLETWAALGGTTSNHRARPERRTETERDQQSGRATGARAS